MQIFLDLEIKRELERYLARVMSLNEFSDWVAPITMDIEQSGSPAAIELVNEIQLRLAEFTDGYWTENQLRELLRPLASTVDVVSPGVRRLWTRSASRREQTEPVAGSL